MTNVHAIAQCINVFHSNICSELTIIRGRLEAQGVKRNEEVTVFLSDIHSVNHH